MIAEDDRGIMVLLQEMIEGEDSRERIAYTTAALVRAVTFFFLLASAVVVVVVVAAIAAIAGGGGGGTLPRLFVFALLQELQIVFRALLLFMPELVERSTLFRPFWGGEMKRRLHNTAVRCSLNGAVQTCAKEKKNTKEQRRTTKNNEEQRRTTKNKEQQRTTTNNNEEEQRRTTKKNNEQQRTTTNNNEEQRTTTKNNEEQRRSKEEAKNNTPMARILAVHQPPHPPPPNHNHCLLFSFLMTTFDTIATHLPPPTYHHQHIKNKLTWFVAAAQGCSFDLFWPL